MRQFLKENSDVADTIEHKIRENAGILSSEMMTPPDLEAGDNPEDENEDNTLQLQAGE